MIFVKDWSTLLQYLIMMVRGFERLLQVMFRGFDSVRISSSPNIEQKVLFLTIAFIQKAVILFLFPIERKHFPKFSKLCKLIAIVTDKHQFAHAVYHPPAILLATEVNALTFTPLSRDTRLFTQGHTCVNRMQGHTCVNRKPDSNNKR